MKMQFFAQCQTTDEVRALYRQLCKENHPDLGPAEETAQRTETMQEINAAYTAFCAAFRPEEMRQRAKQYNKPEPSAEDFINAAEVDEKIRKAVEAVITLAGLEIEVCGLWVWIGGETKTHKEKLKSAGYHFAPKKIKWYFAGIPSNGRGKWDMEEIRRTYGSARVSRPNPYAMSK